MKVNLSVVIQEKGNDIELWRGPQDFPCVPGVGDSVALAPGGYGPSAKVEERIFAVEGGVTIQLAAVKVEPGLSAQVLAGQGWKFDRPYFR